MKLKSVTTHPNTAHIKTAHHIYCTINNTVNSSNHQAQSNQQSLTTITVGLILISSFTKPNLNLTSSLFLLVSRTPVSGTRMNFFNNLFGNNARRNNNNSNNNSNNNNNNNSNGSNSRRRSAPREHVPPSNSQTRQTRTRNRQQQPPPQPRPQQQRPAQPQQSQQSQQSQPPPQRQNININDFQIPNGMENLFAQIFNQSGSVRDDVREQFQQFVHQAEQQQEQSSTAIPPASDRAIRTIPTVMVTPEDLVDENNRECCICFESHQLGDKVSRLPCAHICKFNMFIVH